MKNFQGKLVLWPVVCLLFMTGACKLSDDNNKATLSTYIYIAGATTGFPELFWTPCVWKNGVRSDLDFPAEENGWATSVFVSGDIVYCAGYLQYPLKGWGIAMYWKDGVRVGLPISSGDMGADATGIRVAGNDVYVCGNRAVTYYKDKFLNRQVLFIPCVWQNGVISNLPVINDGCGGYANSIFVAGQDVYVAGWIYDLDGGHYLPCFWKNGQRLDLKIPDGGTAAMAAAIFVLGDDIFVAGSVILASTLTVPGLWKNGEWSELSRGDPDKSGSATGVFVEGTDVYACGKTSNGPCTWTNGERRDLVGSNGTTAGLHVMFRAVYVAGHVGFKVPCYWKNGDQLSLNVQKVGSSGMANAIFMANQ